MTTINTYLTFKGNCEAAFDFYKQAFGGEFAHVGRFKDMPQNDPNCQVDQSEQNKIMHISYPLWTIVVFGIAVFSGFLGSVGLILKKKWSKSAFILSLCAIIPQMIHNVFFTKSMEVYGPGEATTMPIMVVTFGIFLVWFSDRLIRKEWLK